jgi:hypothetical protein
MFKLNQLVMAVAATLVAGQAMAAAVTPADIAAARTAGSLQEAWVSGNSAPTYNVFQGYADGCDAGTVSFFHDNTKAGVLKPGSAGNFMAYACTRGGQVSVMYHTIDGGSYNAFAPHLEGVQLKRLKNIDNKHNTTCALQSGSTFSAGTNQPAVAIYNNCTTVTGAIAADASPTLPDGGFSDVEAALFGKDVSAVGTQTSANYGQVFGIVVSTSLYRAMQVAQGIYADTGTADSSDPNFLPVNAPNISSSQYASIVAGTIPTWETLLGALGKNKNVYIGRRTSSSGTQASSNAFFLKNPCNGDPNIGGALPALTANDSTSTITVTEDSSTTNLKNRFNTNNFIIGVMSLENNWRQEVDNNGVKSDNFYRYIKLDGSHPEAPIPGSGTTADLTGRYTAASGVYNYHIEMVNFIANTATPFGAQVINDITNAFQNVPCSDVPRGMTLNPLSGSSCTAGIQVARGTRFGNNCQAQQILPF